MPALALTAAQTTLINAIETALEQAFSAGVNDNTSAALIPALQLYNTLTVDQKASCKACFKSTLAAFMTSANFPSTGYTGSVLVTGVGTLTIVNGIVTAFA